MTDFDLSKGLQGIDRLMRDTMADAGGVNTPELKGAAKVLAQSIRKTLRRGKGSPSSPGEPPSRQTGKLANSVRDGVIGAGRWVGPTFFTAAFLERGTKAPKSAARNALNRMTGKGRAARPFMDRSLAAVQDQMTDVMVSEIRARKDL